jgi:hypothetical protein
MIYMTFEEYVKELNDYLQANPGTAKLKMFVSNGYCTSEEYVQVRRKPMKCTLHGKMAKRFPGDVLVMV